MQFGTYEDVRNGPGLSAARAPEQVVSDAGRRRCEVSSQLDRDVIKQGALQEPSWVESSVRSGNKKRAVFELWSLPHPVRALTRALHPSSRGYLIDSDDVCSPYLILLIDSEGNEGE